MLIKANINTSLSLIAGSALNLLYLFTLFVNTSFNYSTKLFYSKYRRSTSVLPNYNTLSILPTAIASIILFAVPHIIPISHWTHLK